MPLPHRTLHEHAVDYWGQLCSPNMTGCEGCRCPAARSQSAACVVTPRQSGCSLCTLWPMSRDNKLLGACQSINTSDNISHDTHSTASHEGGRSCVSCSVTSGQLQLPAGYRSLYIC